MRYDPHDFFSQIMEVARAGESGETYAVNADGLMISQSRFFEDLHEIGLLAPDVHSTIHQIAVRDLVKI